MTLLPFFTPNVTATYQLPSRPSNNKLNAHPSRKDNSIKHSMAGLILIRRLLRCWVSSTSGQRPRRISLRIFTTIEPLSLLRMRANGWTSDIRKERPITLIVRRRKETIVLPRKMAIFPSQTFFKANDPRPTARTRLIWTAIGRWRGNPASLNSRKNCLEWRRSSLRRRNPKNLTPIAAKHNEISILLSKEGKTSSKDAG